MQKVLFLSLGNRDLQLPQDAKISIDTFSTHFEGGNIDTGGNFVLKKTDKQFLEHSEAVFKLYPQLAASVCFPMLEATLNEVGTDLAQIVLLTTAQQPLDTQDCHFIALFLEKWLSEKGYSVTYRPISFPPVDLEKLMDFYSNLYDEFAEFKIYFGNSGGTPDMRAATHMAGMFRGIHFVTIQARDKTSTVKNFAQQEQTVLKHIVAKMLSSFDYGGILNLPLGNLQIEKLAQYALARLQLDHGTVRSLHQELGYSELYLKEQLEILDLEQEMVQSARIKLHQKAYADYLWRLFTISDNLLIPHVEQVLGGSVIYDKNSNHASWNNLLANDSDLIQYLDQKIINHKPLMYSEPNAFAYQAILSFYTSKGLWQESPIMAKVRINLEAIRGLRNQIAHYYKGINQEEIESKLIAKHLPDRKASLDSLNQILCQYTNVDYGSNGVYTWINAKILDLLR